MGKLNRRAKAALISNICIAVVLVGLGIAVFTTDLSMVFLSVSGPVYNGNTEKNNVSLMFNVFDGIGSEEQFLEQIVDVLAAEGVGATFFLNGSWVSRNMNRTKVLAARGFELGNHGFNYKDMKKLKKTQQRQEIQNCHTLVESTTRGILVDDSNPDGTFGLNKGCEMNLFFPPMGSFSKTTLKAAEDLKYKTIMWNKNGITEALTQPQGGDLILLPIGESVCSELADIIHFIKEKGFGIVAVGQNIL